MMEVTHGANNSPASEVVMILDCCHAGAAAPVTNSVLEPLGNGLTLGRDMLAGCSAHQKGWEEKNETDQKMGAFSSVVLEGLEGKARNQHNRVRGSLLGVHVTEAFRSWN